MSEESKKYLDRDGRLNSELRDLIEGMSVSIDVSTGDHDSGNRLFGVVNEVMDDSHDKCGVTLLVYDTKPNFNPSEQPAPASTGRDALSYGPVHVVADLVRNLLTLDQSAPIYSAFHVDHQGQRRCRTRGVMTSWERVIDGKWVDPARTDVPYAVIVWAKPEQDEAAPVAARMLDVEAERREFEAAMADQGHTVTRYYDHGYADATLHRWEGWCAAGSAAQSTQPESAQVSTEQAGDAWQMVPRVITDDMHIAFAEVWFSKVRPIDSHDMQDAYAASSIAA